MAAWICLLVFLCSSDILVQARSATKELKTAILKDVLAELKKIPDLEVKEEAVKIPELGRFNKGISRKGREFLAQRQSLPPSCTAEYQALPASTMCDFWDDPAATNSGVSDADVTQILLQHNDYRASVSPNATNMLRMYWDEEIARIAQKYADVCVTVEMSHDTNDQRQVPGYGINIGQNLAWGYPTWQDAITAWHIEVLLYNYGGPNEDFAAIGHYTQEVNANAVQIGCGYAHCPIHGPTYVCNYAYGQMSDEVDAPYEAGQSCAACPDFEVDNLCDCGDILCRNGGDVDVATCTCTCAEPYVGSSCEEISCPASEPYYCGSQWPPSYCEMYSNVPGTCPYMCGICGDGEEENCPGVSEDSCLNGGTLNSDCECDCPPGVTGDQCETLEDCPVAEDAWWCVYISNWWCNYYTNVQTSCPYACGSC